MGILEAQEKRVPASINTIWQILNAVLDDLEKYKSDNDLKDDAQVYYHALNKIIKIAEDKNKEISFTRSAETSAFLKQIIKISEYLGNADNFLLTTNPTIEKPPDIAEPLTNADNFLLTTNPTIEKPPDIAEPLTNEEKTLDVNSKEVKEATHHMSIFPEEVEKQLLKDKGEDVSYEAVFEHFQEGIKIRDECINQITYKLDLIEGMDKHIDSSVKPIDLEGVQFLRNTLDLITKAQTLDEMNLIKDSFETVLKKVTNYVINASSEIEADRRMELQQRYQSIKNALDAYSLVQTEYLKTIEQQYKKLSLELASAAFIQLSKTLTGPIPLPAHDKLTSVMSNVDSTMDLLAHEYQFDFYRNANFDLFKRIKDNAVKYIKENKLSTGIGAAVLVTSALACPPAIIVGLGGAGTFISFIIKLMDQHQSNQETITHLAQHYTNILSYSIQNLEKRIQLLNEEKASFLTESEAEEKKQTESPLSHHAFIRVEQNLVRTTSLLEHLRKESAELATLSQHLPKEDEKDPKARKKSFDLYNKKLREKFTKLLEMTTQTEARTTTEPTPDVKKEPDPVYTRYHF